MKKSFIGTAFVVFGAFLLAGFGSVAQAGAVNFSNVRAGSITPGAGHVGVDIWWSGSNSSVYNPCHHSNDIYYGACVMSNSGLVSYYKVMNYNPGSTNFPYGIFIDNQNPNYCTTAVWCQNPSVQIINHGWGNLVAGASLEIYPYNSAGVYNPSTGSTGGVRISLNSFPLLANGGRYSTDVGNISLPQLGQGGVGKLNGFVTFNGVAVNNGRAAFDVFQNGSSRSTSTGYPMSGFSSVQNNGDGYYSTGAVPSGSYKLYITDLQTNRKVMLDGVAINSPHERLDFKLDQHCLGFPNLNCVDPL